MVFWVFYLTARSTREPGLIYAGLRGKTFDVSERVDTLLSRARRDVTERHNEEVRQNREMLRTLSDSLKLKVKKLFINH